MKTVFTRSMPTFTFWLLIYACQVATNLPQAYAQDRTANIKNGDSFFEKQDFHNALALYEAELKANPDNKTARMKAGITQLYLAKTEEGLKRIKLAKTEKSDTDPYYFFWLGRGFHLNMKVDSALIQYRKYLSLSDSKDEYRDVVSEFVKQIHQTEAYFVTSEQSPYTINNLGQHVNSPYTESSPMLSPEGDVLIFVSRRPLFADEKSLVDGEYLEKVFYTMKQSDNSWGKAELLFSTKDQKNLYKPVQFLPNTSSLLLHQPNDPDKLFVAERDQNGGFKSPVVFSGMLPTQYFQADGALNPEFKKAVFVKNTIFDGTFDLYQAQIMQNGKWSKAEKLPDFINSPQDEVGPTLLNNGKTLIYASKGLPGMGGFDLYRSDWDESVRNWSRPQNLGYPINTPGDEISYHQGKNGKVFISSARAKGYGSADIYELVETPKGNPNQ